MSSVNSVVQAHFDDYDNWPNKRDWYNQAIGLSSRYPEEKREILLLIDEKRKDEKDAKKVNKIMQRAGMVSKTKTRRGFGTKAPKKKNSQGGGCETGDCDDQVPKSGGLKPRKKGDKPKMAKSSGTPSESEKIGPIIDSKDLKIVTDKTVIPDNIKEEFGIGAIKDIKSLREFFLKSKLEKDIYFKRVLDIYKIAYPTITNTQLTPEEIQDLNDTKITKLEKLYLELVQGGINQVGFTV